MINAIARKQSSNGNYPLNDKENVILEVMEWNDLWRNFLCGQPDAIQAIFSGLGFLITLAGTLYVAITFHQQKKINRQQQSLNELTFEKHRREVRPIFSATTVDIRSNIVSYDLFVKNALAKNITINELETHFSKGIVKTHNIWEPEDHPVRNAFRVASRDMEDSVLVIKIIEFQDEDGRDYFQEVKFKDRNVFVTFPILLKKSKRVL